MATLLIHSWWWVLSLVGGSLDSALICGSGSMCLSISSRTRKRENNEMEIIFLSFLFCLEYQLYPSMHGLELHLITLHRQSIHNLHALHPPLATNGGWWRLWWSAWPLQGLATTDSGILGYVQSGAQVSFMERLMIGVVRKSGPPVSTPDEGWVWELILLLPDLEGNNESWPDVTKEIHDARQCLLRKSLPGRAWVTSRHGKVPWMVVTLCLE